MIHVPDVTLNNGIAMPQLGLGLFKVSAHDATGTTGTALDAGYRSIDTATLYNNEAEVGQAIAQSEVAREDIFVTTKLWNTDQGYDQARRAFDTSLHLLDLDYIDLYLVHWPAPGRDRYVETWRALEKILADGQVRAIGVSNFKIPHLQRLLDESGTVPAVNQVELHPRLQQADLREFHNAHRIATEAWSPLARGALLDDRTIVEIARKHGVTPAQAVLRWHIQIGNIVIPKSTTPDRIRANIDVFDFLLDQSDMEQIAALDRNERIGPDPDTFNG